MKKIRNWIVACALLLPAIPAHCQDFEALISYFEQCESKTCLDTLQTIPNNAILNEANGAKRMFEVALGKAEELNEEVVQAQILLQLSMIDYYFGNYETSFELKLKAIKIFEATGDKKGAGIAYSSLGYEYKRINFDKALDYMIQGIKLLEEIQDQEQLSNSYNNFGVLMEMSDDWDSANHYYDKSLQIKRERNDSIGIPYSLENVALVQIHNKQFKLAEKNLIESANIRLIIDEKRGLIGNYINLAELYSTQNQFKRAISYLNEALKMEKQVNYPFAAQYCYEKLTNIYQKQRQFDKAFESLMSATTIKDSLINVENAKTVERLTVQFETEKKEKEITLLTVQNQLKDTEIDHADKRFYATIGGVVLLALLAYVLFNRYKYKQRALLSEEREINQKLRFRSVIEAEEKERKRIAQELHDGLGQLLSTAKLNVSAVEDKVEDPYSKQIHNSIKLIDDAVTEVRTISHNMMPNALISIGFEAALREQIHIINDAGTLTVHAELPEEKIDLPEAEAIALYRIIQEILNNAIKYAEASNIWLKMKKNGDLSVAIKDDGKGFDTKVVQASDGIGWQNIQSRVEILNGVLDIDSQLGKGSTISLKIAV